MSDEEALNELRKSFDNYIRDEVLKVAKLDNLGNNVLRSFL